MTAQYLRHKYGDAVQVDYIDFATPRNREQYAEILKEIETRRLRFPVTAIDDAIISEGHVDYWTIATSIEEKLRQETIPKGE